MKQDQNWEDKMTKRTVAILWVGIIILGAIISSGMGLSDGASFGIIAGLTGAAWGSLYPHKSCRQGCSL